ncbi:EI24 domain-containing protein [Erythrobacter crassostreae]|uniref:EI24 domain-containing protein n=1 Tax=Erythrobacter crassostreae TaxID=2828328 RepID=A0A9X1F1W9_9SPHN|nr:EI24 domain-containing protein [Erythrobacter crassostrea]MBV7258629.1 EI24 domain-containing protein [Erythrobacter crassostrea]
MNAVIASLSKAFGQLGDPAILKVAAKSIGITVLLFIAMGIGFYFGIVCLTAAYGSASEDGWLEAIAAAILAILGFWFLFRIVALAVLQFFADKIVAAVEAKHYPDLAEKAKPLPLPQDIANSFKGLGRALGFNLLALPFAIVLIFTAFGPAVVFLLVNAVLLGRELTDMAWLRHTDGQPLPSPVSGTERLMLGGVIAAMMLVPFLNLIAPVIGAAAGTHLAHDAMRRQEAAHA